MDPVATGLAQQGGEVLGRELLHDGRVGLYNESVTKKSLTEDETNLNLIT